VKDCYRESCTWSKNRLAKTFSAPKICGPRSALLLQENLHVLKVKGHHIGLEEIVADHAGEVKAKYAREALSECGQRASFNGADGSRAT